MQREGIGGSISLEIVPGQRHARDGRERTAKAAEQCFSTTFNSIEIDHHRPSTLPTAVGVRGVFLRPRRKPVCVFLEVLAWVVALTLDGFRQTRIHTKQRRKPLIKACSKLRMILTQMAGSAGAVIAGATSHRRRLQ